MNSFFEIVKNYKVVFLDSYGVVKNFNGLIPNVQQTIDWLRKNKILFRIMTNDASRSSEVQAQRFEQQGLKGIAPHEIITSGMMAKQFLTYKVNTGTVVYLGTKQAAAYILQADLNAIPINAVNLDDIDAISAVVFLDDEGFDWNKDINIAVNLLRRKNIPTIVANSDKLYPVTKNDVAIATGGVAQLVESIIGKKFIHFGKPDSQMFMYAFEDINREGEFTRNDILMVGDTLHTDILGGNRFGIDTMLVLTGNTRPNEAELSIKMTGIIPDYIGVSIVE